MIQEIMTTFVLFVVVEKKDIAKLNESVELEHAVKKSKIPIILGIGHKSDTMKFADYVAKECINPIEAAYFINECFMRLRSEKKIVSMQAIYGVSTYSFVLRSVKLCTSSTRSPSTPLLSARK